MARLPYADESRDEAEFVELAAQIRAERGGTVPNLYRMLLNSPPVAQGWLNLLTAIRHKASLSGKLRELVILRIALINRADYEYAAHAPFAVKEGLSQEKIDALPNWQDTDVFDATERAVLAYADAMTKDIQVDDDVFAAAANDLDAQEMTELTATIAAYNLVSRFLEAIKIDHEH